ncbi:hypothetical protein [Cecembia calidifontis]|jgi:hypothetical protein|uniref:hypothetical protein n=1 Tax=Cecembia calidifontis TaxID=1187080 RepID=UPI00102A1BD4|nr:hypothetical protein [Cecembia calidifontis]
MFENITLFSNWVEEAKFVKEGDEYVVTLKTYSEKFRSDSLGKQTSLLISVLVTGADDAKMLQEKIDLAKNFKALNEAKRMELVEKVAGFEGQFVEYYKV